MAFTQSSNRLLHDHDYLLLTTIALLLSLLVLVPHYLYALVVNLELRMVDILSSFHHVSSNVVIFLFFEQHQQASSSDSVLSTRFCGCVPHPRLVSVVLWRRW
jgi:hypothetical protein